MRTSSFLPVWQGLGDTSLGMVGLLPDTNKRKTPRINIDQLILRAVNESIKMLDGYKRKFALESLAELLMINAEFSVATAQLFEIIIPAFSKSSTTNRRPNFFASIYKIIEDKEAGNGFFLENTRKLSIAYLLSDTDWTRQWIHGLMDMVIKQKDNKYKLIKWMIHAISTDTKIPDYFSKKIKFFVEKEQYFPFYWSAIRTIMQTGKESDLISAAFAVYDDKIILPQSHIEAENIISEGQKIINVLTLDNYGKDRSGVFVSSTQEVEFFCVLTSEKPRQQLLDAWKQLTCNVENINRKFLCKLSWRADQKLPRKKDDDISVIVTLETFNDFFPLLQS